MKNEEAILERIDFLEKVGGTIKFQGSQPSDIAREVYIGTLELLSNLYGSNSHQAEAIKSSDVRIGKLTTSIGSKNSETVKEMRGFLRTARAEIKNGLIQSIRNQVKGEILGDFLLLAKQTLEDSKDVAAVLACAALEDTLKRLAEVNELACDDKALSEVVNALKSKGLVSGAQGKVLQSFVPVRNKAFHAEWSHIEAAEVHAVIGFLQTFLPDRFA